MLSVIFLNILLLLIILKLITRICERNPRFVEAASTLPGPVGIPWIGNGLAFAFPGNGGDPRHYTKFR